MGSSFSTSASAQPRDDIGLLAEKLNALIDQEPWKLSDMLKVIGALGESTPEEKLQLYHAGVVERICKLIRENNGRDDVVLPSATAASPKRKSVATFLNRAPPKKPTGTGYGSGTTNSKWDIERTVEKKIAREEHLMWLLCALNTYLWGDSLKLSEVNASVLAGRGAVHLVDDLLPMIMDTAVFPMLENHLNNDSILDISQHLDFYQALVELTAGLSLLPSFLPHLVTPKDPESKSIAKDLIPKFSNNLNAYMNNTKLPISLDHTLIDFIKRINDLTALVLHCAGRYESELPPEKKIKSETPKALSPPSSMDSSSVASSSSLSQEEVYKNLLEKLQMTSMRLIDDQNLPIYSLNYKNEIKAINPIAASNRERNRRIAKELASMTSSLPLTFSSSIFVVMDEARVDVLKVLITGPEDTPYQNGLFEFDIFFPADYPNVPPKCQFLTTGNGSVRFNPNLYNNGKVCLSILGTWEGRPEEKWNPLCTCLQVLVSIQALILVREPYFNEPGYQQMQGTPQGDEANKRYNFNIEHATLCHALYGQLKHPPVYFKDVIMRHLWIKRHDIIKQAGKWLESSKSKATTTQGSSNSLGFPAAAPVTISDAHINLLIHELQNMTDPTVAAPPTARGDAASTAPPPSTAVSSST